ncbi:MAG: hypothetical protein ABIN96_02175 [Rubrivivax sp.]
MDGDFDLVEYARDGKWSAEANGTFEIDHTFWKGFSRRNAAVRADAKTPDPIQIPADAVGGRSGVGPHYHRSPATLEPAR